MTTPLYCGIDLHSNNSVVSIQDKQSKQVYEKRLPHLFQSYYLGFIRITFPLLLSVSR